MTEADASVAVAWLKAFLTEYEPELIDMARGRLARGLFAFPGGPLYRKTREELTCELAEELADAIVYGSRYLDL